jgi:hypothetical protein
MALERLQKKNETLVVCEVGLINSFNDSAEQHRLAFAGIALGPLQTALLVVPPLLEVGVFFEDPVVRVSEEATLILLDAVLVVAGVGRLAGPADRLGSQH